MTGFSLSPAAAQDLADIAAHVAADRPGAASRLLDTLEAACRLVAEYPGVGRARDEVDVGVRSFPVGVYVIFYYPGARGVGIARILHARRDASTSFHVE